MIHPTEQLLQSPVQPPIMTREAFANFIGLSLGVLIAQASRDYWPQITIGRRVFINVEVVRLKAAERVKEFVL